MASSLCKSSAFKIYHDVIDDVIFNVREQFLEEGVDDTVLQELKTLWQSKLAATKAVEETKELDKAPVNPKPVRQQQWQNVCNQYTQQQNQNVSAKQVVGQVRPNNHMPQGIAFPEWRRVPIQLTIPLPPGSLERQRVLAIEVPEIFLQGNYMKSILTGQVISATMNLPLNAASAYLQDHVNNAFLMHQQSTNIINVHMGVNPTVLQTDGTSDDADKKHVWKTFQNELPVDSSDEDETISLHDVSEDDAEEQQEGEPLNSGDDISDDDGTEESFETENVIVCQFDKISRTRNRWKFNFKDGIMALDGEDYVFHKANGDAEW